MRCPQAEIVGMHDAFRERPRKGSRDWGNLPADDAPLYRAPSFLLASLSFPHIVAEAYISVLDFAKTQIAQGEDDAREQAGFDAAISAESGEEQQIEIAGAYLLARTSSGLEL